MNKVENLFSGRPLDLIERQGRAAFEGLPQDVRERFTEAFDLTLALARGKSKTAEFVEYVEGLVWDDEGDQGLMAAQVVITTLSRITVETKDRTCRRALIGIGDVLRRVATDDFEKGLEILGLTFIPLAIKDKGVRRHFANVFNDLERRAGSDEKKFQLSIFAWSALAGKAPVGGVESNERVKILERSQRRIASFADQISALKIGEEPIKPSMLALLVGVARHEGGEIVDSPADPPLLVIKELAETRLKEILKQAGEAGEGELIKFARTLVAAAKESTSETAFILTAKLLMGDQRFNLHPPFACVLQKAANPQSPLRGKAVEALKTMIKEGLRVRVEARGLSEELTAILLYHVLGEDYPQPERRCFFREFLRTQGCSLPLNLEVFLEEMGRVIRSGGIAFVIVQDGVPYLFEGDLERSREEQREQIIKALELGTTVQKALVVGEYSSRQEQPPRWPEKKELSLQAEIGSRQLVEADSLVAKEVVPPETAAAEGEVIVDLEDDPSLPAKERIERFLQRLLVQRVLEEMDEDEVLEILEAAEKRWKEIYPRHRASRTHSFSLGGTNYRLKARQRKPTRARVRDLPRLSFYHPPFESERQFSDVYVDLYVAEDLCLRLALNRKGDLVALEKGEEEQEFFALLNSDPYAGNHLREQLEALIINNAYHALKTEERILSARARGVVMRAFGVLAGRERETRQRKRSPKKRMRRRKPSPVQSLMTAETAVVVYDVEEESPYPSDESFIQALQSGEVIVERSALSEKEILGMRRHHGRGGYREPREVKGLGDRGGIMWLPLMEEITGETNEEGRVVIRLSPKLPSLAARARAESSGVPLRKADIWMMDENGELHCLTVYSTFRRASVAQKQTDTSSDQAEDYQQ